MSLKLSGRGKWVVLTVSEDMSLCWHRAVVTTCREVLFVNHCHGLMSHTEWCVCVLAETEPHFSQSLPWTDALAGHWVVLVCVCVLADCCLAQWPAPMQSRSRCTMDRMGSAAFTWCLWCWRSWILASALKIWRWSWTPLSTCPTATGWDGGSVNRISSLWVKPGLEEGQWTGLMV